MHMRMLGHGMSAKFNSVLVSGECTLYWRTNSPACQCCFHNIAFSDASQHESAQRFPPECEASILFRLPAMPEQAEFEIMGLPT